MLMFFRSQKIYQTLVAPVLATALFLADSNFALAETASTSATWSCSVTSNPKDKNGFTVGEVFQLQCEGPSAFLKEPLHIELPDVMLPAKEGSAPQKDTTEKYKLVLLQPTSLSDNKIEYSATSYIPGEHAFKSFKIVDTDKKEILISPLALKVQSVIDPQQQKPEPFGPIHPLRMEWPVWLFFTAVIILLVLVGWAIVFFRRWAQKKSIERNIKKYLSPMGSYHQYHKDLRLLKQGVVFTSHQSWSSEEIKKYMIQLEEHFKMFLLREFIIPAPSWSQAVILKAVKQKDKKGFALYQKSLIKALNELEKYKEGLDSLKPKDCEQITALCAQAVDSIWSSQKTKADSQRSEKRP